MPIVGGTRTIPCACFFEDTVLCLGWYHELPSSFVRVIPPVGMLSAGSCSQGIMGLAVLG